MEKAAQYTVYLCMYPCHNIEYSRQCKNFFPFCTNNLYVMIKFKLGKLTYDGIDWFFKQSWTDFVEHRFP